MKNSTKFIWHNMEHFDTKENLLDFPDIKGNLNTLKQNVETSPEKIRGKFLKLANELQNYISLVDKNEVFSNFDEVKVGDTPKGNTVIVEKNEKANSVYNQFDNYRYIYHEGHQLIDLLKTKYGIAVTFFENPRKNEKGVVILLSKDPFGPLNEKMTAIKLVNNKFYLDDKPITLKEAEIYFPEIEKRIKRLKADLNNE